LDVCPKYPYDFAKLSKFVFGGLPKDPLIGNAGSFYIGQTYDKELLLKSSTGGIITALLIHALRKGIIDGAIVARLSDSSPLEPEIIVARTEKELRSSSGPLFCPVPINTKIKEVLNEDGRFAFVGLPCHIQGLRKAEMVNARLRKRVVLHIGHFCSHNVSFRGTGFLLRKLGIHEEDIAKIDYRAKRNLTGLGGFSVKLRDGKEFFIKNQLYWSPFGAFFFTPSYCMLCHDHTSEFADISVGNAWKLRDLLDQEHTRDAIVISRTKVGQEILKSAQSERRIKLIGIDRELAQRSQEEDLIFKKKSYGTRICILRRFGKNALPHSNETRNSLISYLPLMLIHFNSTTFSSPSLERILVLIPFPIFRLYHLAIYGMLKLVK
jgi:coenzyme F420 hydrogenase subunit beta